VQGPTASYPVKMETIIITTEYICDCEKQRQ